MSVTANLATKTGKHQWRFSRLGGFDQVQLNNSQDLLALPELDQKLWAALSCPAHGLQIDGETLAFLDSDGDDRIRVPEIIAAVQWTNRLLKNPDDLLNASADLPLSAINDSDEEGLQLLASAKEILKNLGKSDASILTEDDLADISKIFADTRFNGDGVIPAQAAGNDADRQLMEDIINCYGSKMDRSGIPGIDRDIMDRFFADLTLYADWWRQSPALSPEHSPFKQNLGAAEIFTPLKSKIDDYFTRCQLAEYDLRAGELLNPSVTAYELLAGKDLTASQQELATLPLASIAAGQALPLKHGVNPAWAVRLNELRSWVITPLFGEIDVLSFEQWRSISERFTDYLAWQRQKPEVVAEPLGADRILAILENGSRDRLNALIAEDEALAPEAEAMASVKKLLLYRRDLYKLLNNFVNFHDFYTVHADGIFQVGTLYIDGRDCQLCIRVDDINKHSAMAALGGIYLAYCECKRNNGGNEKIVIAAAITGGDADNLMLGRNGIFYDRAGRDWDATIIKIVEHPISISQAFWAPYKRLILFINEQIEKFAAAKDKEAHALASNHIAETGGQAAAETKPATPAPFDVGRFAGIFAAIGLAIGAIGTAVASLVSGFLNLAWWRMPLALFGIMLLISGPSMLMAFMKLRQRNLAPVLDASGWAINTKAYINIPFAGTLTGTAKLPANAVRELSDPFAEKARPWRLYVLIILLGAAVLALAQQQGYLGHWPPFGKITVNKKLASVTTR